MSIKSAFQKVVDLAKTHKKLTIAAAVGALVVLGVLMYFGDRTSADAAQSNIHSRATAQESGFQVETYLGCSSSEVVAALMSAETKEASVVLFRSFAEVDVCVDFGRPIPVQAMAPVAQVDGWAGTVVVWLFRVEYGDGTSDDFYWAMDKETSKKVMEHLGVTGS